MSITEQTDAEFDWIIRDGILQTSTDIAEIRHCFALARMSVDQPDKAW
jgi:hypothetical protein